MASYAFWNNKGGVGKSFLCFISACEYAHRHPETDVYVIDLCPQANLSETLLASHIKRASVVNALTRKVPRATVAGYVEARLNSPFKPLADVNDYLTAPRQTNPGIPTNLKLVCGDNLLEILSEAIRQTSQLSIPTDAWKQVINWIKDLTIKLREMSGDRSTMFVIDCNPSFAIYTQLALAAADFVVVPFTADDSSRRAVENVVALLYGIGDAHTAAYAKISFAKRAREDGIEVPKLHTFVSNRQTLYEGKPSKAFEAVSRVIKDTVDEIYSKNRTIFADPRRKPSEGFLEVPDYHGASIVAAMTGTPLHALKAGPREIGGERIQVNPGPLANYRKALERVVDCF
jgi:cellulose biosynthesis protein BcsQ